MSTWDEYAALARHLDHLHRSRDAVTAGATERRDAVSTGATQLEQRLAAQHERLSRLGRAIGQHVSSRPAEPSDITDPAVAVRLGFERADAADATATVVEDLGSRPQLFPSFAPVTRNVIVYLGCALLAVVVQSVLVVAGEGRIDAFSLLAWAFAGLPAAAFFAGYLVLSIWGQPRLAAGTPPRSPRLGFAICFLALPVVYCGYKVVQSLGS
jgi:hypothetical protein